MESLNSYIINLVRQLLDMADAEAVLSPIDKDTFEDVMKYGSVSKVAKLK